MGLSDRKMILLLLAVVGTITCTNGHNYSHDRGQSNCHTPISRSHRGLSNDALFVGIALFVAELLTYDCPMTVGFC